MDGYQRSTWCLSGWQSTTFYHNASKEWNSLPEDLRAIESKTFFRHELMKYLFIRADQRDLSSYVFYYILSRPVRVVLSVINNVSNQIITFPNNSKVNSGVKPTLTADGALMIEMWNLALTNSFCRVTLLKVLVSFLLCMFICRYPVSDHCGKLF